MKNLIDDFSLIDNKTCVDLTETERYEYHLIIDLDGTVAKWATAEKDFGELLEKDYFFNLAPEYRLIDNIADYLDRNPDTDAYVLSAYFTDTPYPLQDKKRWCDTHLSFIPENKRIFVPYGENKAKHFEKETGFNIDNSFIMLEDYTPALIDWENAGGVGLKFMNGINGTKGVWRGHRLYKEETDRRLYALDSVIKHDILRDL